MSFTLPDLLFSIVIFQLLFAGSYLFVHPGGRRIGNRILAVFFLSIGLNLTDNFLVIKRVYLFSPWYVSWGICLPLLFGPLLYLYTRSVLYRSFTLSRKKWLHFLPFIAAFLTTELIYLSRTKGYLLGLLNNMTERRIPPAFYWTSGIIFLQYFVYLAACLRLIGQYKKVVRDNYSDPRRADLRWLYTTILFFSCCMFLTAFNGFLGLTTWSKYYYFVFGAIVGLLFVFIYRILLATLLRPAIFGLLEEQAPGAIADADSPQLLPVTSTFTPEPGIAMLVREMQDNKPYLDPDLTLEKLAARLSLRPKVLSKVINDGLHKHFFDFINSYRIDEAKRLLTNPPDRKFTVLEVLYQCGFNSKSSFNTLFKRYTGMTPTVFRKTR
jgi:AraC-like DNA-binding protein